VDYCSTFPWRLVGLVPLVGLDVNRHLSQAAARLRVARLLWVTRLLAVSQAAADSQPAAAGSQAGVGSRGAVDNPTVAGSHAAVGSQAAVDNTAPTGFRSRNAAEHRVHLAGWMPDPVVSGFAPGLS